MEKVTGENAGRETTSMGKVAFASFIGTAIEFYDWQPGHYELVIARKSCVLS